MSRRPRARFADSNAVGDRTAMARNFRDFSSRAKKFGERRPEDCAGVRRKSWWDTIKRAGARAPRSSAGEACFAVSISTSHQLAACPHRLRQNLKLRLPAAPEQPSSLTAAACGDQHRREPLAAQPVEKSSPLLRSAGDSQDAAQAFGSILAQDAAGRSSRAPYSRRSPRKSRSFPNGLSKWFP